MAEDLVKASEFGNFNKKGDGEDPIIVVQRFLNIFRQLHIFNDRKREEFNQMLLDLSDDVRSKLTAIPGGTLLKEYAEEIEAKHGVKRQTEDVTAIDENNEDVIKAKIFAKALAEAQAKFNPIPQTVTQTAPQAPIFIPINDENSKLQERLGTIQKAMQTAKAANDDDKLNELQKESTLIQNKLKATGIPNIPSLSPNISGDLRVVADKAFAKEMADALAQAMQSVERQRTPVKEIADALAQAMQAVERAPIVVENNNKGTEELLDGIIKFSEESRQKNMGEIAKTISESQIKLAQMMIEHNATMTASMPVVQADGQTIAAPMPMMPPVEDIISGVVKAQTEQLSNMISSALRESHQLSTKSMIEALTTMQKDNMKLMEIQAKNSAIKAQTAGVREEPRAFAHKAEVIASGPVVKPQLKKEIINAGLDNSLFDIDDLETPNDGVINTRNIGEMTEQAKGFVIEKNVANKMDMSVSKVFAKPEDKEPPASIVKQAIEKAVESEPQPAPVADSVPAVETTPKEVIADVESEPETTEEWEWQESDGDVHKEVGELEVKPGLSEDNNSKTSEAENDFIVYEPHEDEAQAIQRSADNVDEDNSSFEYDVLSDDTKEDESDNTTSHREEPEKANEAQGAGEDGEWEWEYEEVEDDGTSPEEDGDWEWEYEEVEDDGASK